MAESLSPARGLWIALVHHPVVDRQGKVVATSVTNLDVHDIARSARTYGLAGVAIVTPIDAQRRIVERIVEYWNEPAHAARSPGRLEALSLVRAVPDVQHAMALAAKDPGGHLVTIGTTSRRGPVRLGFDRLRCDLWREPGRPRLLVLGTGWGLDPALLSTFDHVLEPIRGSTGYNHLSVRSAGAVMLDRLLGQPERILEGT